MGEARWVFKPNGQGFQRGAWACSKCGTANYNLGGNGEIDPLTFRGSTFCPHCGKRMDGKAATEEQPNIEMGGVTMEKLDTVQKQGLLNEVYRVGERGPGGAFHTYVIAKIDREESKNPIIATVKFQKGPRGEETSRDGVLDHELVEIVRDRLKAFQEGEYATDDNKVALFLLEEALKWMNKRVEKRIARGVLGTTEK